MIREPKDRIEEEFLKTVHDYQKIIYKVCRMYRNSKEDQEDLFQEIVYQLWKAFPSFKGESKVSSWLYKIALNTSMAIYRKSNLSYDYYEDIPESIHPSDEVIVSDDEERLFSALQKLNDSEKALISLFLEDFSYQEIAEITGTSQSNVGVRLNRIKNKLKAIIK
jgi:RNA polymerase sigma-70 factor (ECF subfamily)